jgi:hypothetical protein
MASPRDSDRTLPKTVPSLRRRLNGNCHKLTDLLAAGGKELPCCLQGLLADTGARARRVRLDRSRTPTGPLHDDDAASAVAQTEPSPGLC